jgi:hypothetical protein
MSRAEWNQTDTLMVQLLLPVSPLLDMAGFESLEPLLEVIESAGEELRPDKMSLTKRKLKYSRSALRERLHEGTFNRHTAFMLFSKQLDPGFFDLTSLDGQEGVRFSLNLHNVPLSRFQEVGKERERASRIVDMVRGMASRFPTCYGDAHSSTDYYMGYNEDNYHLGYPRSIETICWLNLYGPRLIEQLGRERVLSTPAYHLEELPHGSVLFLTRPTPADFASEEARLAQARALVHLRPELKLEEVLATLYQRSLAFTPLSMQFDPDVSPLLELLVQRVDLSRRHKEIERLNQYHPPPVSEWIPASQMPAPDVDDVPATIQLYEQYSEELVVLLHKHVDSVFKTSPESLPYTDYFLWHRDWANEALTPEGREILARGLGAYLGRLLVHTLGGRWVPRRNLEEVAVVIGPWAWRPFLRGQHHTQSRQHALDYSATQFFHYARRMRDLAWAPPPLPQ